jgi:hypothetical protein
MTPTQHRRAFTLPGYTTYAAAGFDGDYACPIHMTSGNPTGPMLISKDWLDAPSAARHKAQLLKTGYLPDMTFNKVIDRVLAILNLTRADIYITPIFKLLPPRRSHPLPAKDARASWQAVTQYELNGRTPVALGTDSANVLKHFQIPHIAAPHPSARQGSFASRAEQIGAAIRKVL